MNLPITSFSLLYNGKDISAEVSEQVLGIEYDDKVKDESDEIQVTFEDADGRWKNEWYPEKGATLQLYLRAGGAQLDCGSFTIDEIECTCSVEGNTFSIKGIAASFGKKLRSKQSYAHENKSLREIANTVAAGLGLTVQGTILDLRPERTHQYRETALQFLNRLAGKFGYIFSVRGNRLIFTYYKEIEGRPPSVTFKKQDLVRVNIKDSSHLTYKNGRVRYHDPTKKKTISYTTGDEDSEESDTTAEDSLEMYDRAEDDDQAQILAEYGLHKENSFKVGGEIEVAGNLLLVSGNNVQIQGMGKFSGIFQVLNSHHSISRDGAFKTSAQLKRVKLIDTSLYK